MSLSLSILSHLANVETHAKTQGAMLHALRELAKRRGDTVLQEAVSELQGEQVSLIAEVNWINADIGAGRAVGEIQKADVGSLELELHPANWRSPLVIEEVMVSGHHREAVMAALREESRQNKAVPALTVEQIEAMQRTLRRANDDTELGDHQHVSMIEKGGES